MKYFLIAWVAFLLACPLQSYAASTDQTDEYCLQLDDRMKEAGDSMNETAEVIYDEHIKTPSKDDIKECLAGILNPGWGLTLGVPSLDSLWNQACNIVRRGIRDHISDMNQSYTIDVLDGMFSVGGSTSPSGGQSTQPINKKDTSGSVIRDVWDSIQR